MYPLKERTVRVRELGKALTDEQRVDGDALELLILVQSHGQLQRLLLRSLRQPLVDEHQDQADRAVWIVAQSRDVLLGLLAPQARLRGRGDTRQLGMDSQNRKSDELPGNDPDLRQGDVFRGALVDEQDSDLF